METGKKILAPRTIIVMAALAAGLLGAVYIVAQVVTPPRPRLSEKRVAFQAPPANTPAVHHYQAEIHDITRDSTYTQDNLSFTVVAGPVDSHVVFLSLQYRHLYEARVRGFATGNQPGLWSPWSEVYEHASLYATPDPPPDN